MKLAQNNEGYEIQPRRAHSREAEAVGQIILQTQKDGTQRQGKEAG